MYVIDWEFIAEWKGIAFTSDSGFLMRVLAYKQGGFSFWDPKSVETGPGVEVATMPNWKQDVIH